MYYISLANNKISPEEREELREYASRENRKRGGGGGVADSATVSSHSAGHSQREASSAAQEAAGGRGDLRDSKALGDTSADAVNDVAKYSGTPSYNSSSHAVQDTIKHDKNRADRKQMCIRIVL